MQKKTHFKTATLFLLDDIFLAGGGFAIGLLAGTLHAPLWLIAAAGIAWGYCYRRF